MESFWRGINANLLETVGNESSTPPASTPSSAECSKGPDWDLFIHCCLAPSLVIVVILSFFGKRYNFRLKSLFGIKQLAVVFPINLLDDHEHRWSHALAFGATASIIFQLFSGDYTSLYLKDTEDVETWLKIFLGAVATFELGTVLFPFFACITSPSHFVGSLLGFIYVAIWFSVQLAHIITCPNIEGIGGFPYESVVLQLPVVIFTFLLMIRFLFYLILSILKRVQHTKMTSEDKLMISHPAQHVMALLRPPPQPRIYTKRWEKLVYYWYEPTQNFVYPTRIICTFVVAVLCQYQVAIRLSYGLDQSIKSVFVNIRDWYAVYVVTYDVPEAVANRTYRNLDKYEVAAHVSWYFSCAFAIVVSICYIGHIFVCFRKHVLRLYRGDRRFLPDMKLNSTKSMTGSLQYCGFQIAYYLSGYVIMTVMTFVVVYVISGALVIPLTNDALKVIIGFCNVVVPLFLVAFLVFGSQPILARRVFLQSKLNQNDKDKPLALRHRDFYHIFSYFLVFLNVLVGMLSCVIRILTGLFVGVFLLCRIDRPILMRGYEHLDQSYQAYIGNLNMINAHSHPVLVVFCQILVNRILVRKKARLGRNPSGVSDTAASYTFVEHEIGKSNSQTKSYAVVDYGSTNNSSSTLGKSISPHARAVMRWQVAYTLLFNPSLLHTRKRSRQITYEEMEKRILKVATLLPHRQQVLQRSQAATSALQSAVPRAFAVVPQGKVAPGRIRSGQGLYVRRSEQQDDKLAAELLNRELMEDRSDCEDEVIGEKEDDTVIKAELKEHDDHRSNQDDTVTDHVYSNNRVHAVSIDDIHDSDNDLNEDNHQSNAVPNAPRENYPVSNASQSQQELQRNPEDSLNSNRGSPGSEDTSQVYSGDRHSRDSTDDFVGVDNNLHSRRAINTTPHEENDVVIYLDAPSHSSTDDPATNVRVP